MSSHNPTPYIVHGKHLTACRFTTLPEVAAYIYRHRAPNTIACVESADESVEVTLVADGWVVTTEPAVSPEPPWVGILRQLVLMEGEQDASTDGHPDR